MSELKIEDRGRAFYIRIGDLSVTVQKLATPPVVVDEFYVRTRIGYEGTRTLRYEYSSVEVQEFRTIVLASDTGWQNGLESMK